MRIQEHTVRLGNFVTTSHNALLFETISSLYRHIHLSMLQPVSAPGSTYSHDEPVQTRLYAQTGLMGPRKK